MGTGCQWGNERRTKKQQHGPPKKASKKSSFRYVRGRSPSPNEAVLSPPRTRTCVLLLLLLLLPALLFSVFDRSIQKRKKEQEHYITQPRRMKKRGGQRRQQTTRPLFQRATLPLRNKVGLLDVGTEEGVPCRGPGLVRRLVGAHRKKLVEPRPFVRTRLPPFRGKAIHTTDWTVKHGLKHGRNAIAPRP